MKTCKRFALFILLSVLSITVYAAEISIAGKPSKTNLNQSIEGNFKVARRGTSRIYPDSQGKYFIDGRVNGKSMRFLVDTGATFVTLNSRHAKIAGINFREGSRALMQTATQTISVWQVRLSSINVGQINLTNVEAWVIEGSEPEFILLGNSFLGRTEIIRKGRVMELRKTIKQTP